MVRSRWNPPSHLGVSRLQELDIYVTLNEELGEATESDWDPPNPLALRETIEGLRALARDSAANPFGANAWPQVIRVGSLVHSDTEDDADGQYTYLDTSSTDPGTPRFHPW